MAKRGRLSSGEREDIKRLHSEGKTVEEISLVLNRSVATVNKVLSLAVTSGEVNG